MVSIIDLHQLYKRQEITEVKWIYKYHNLADFIIKVKPSSVLKTLIDINCININIIE